MPGELAGREAILAAHRALTAAVGDIRIRDVRFHQTDDPAVAVAEHRLEVDLHGDDVYENELVSRITFRDGRVVEVKEHYGQRAHEAFLRAIGAVA